MSAFPVLDQLLQGLQRAHGTRDSSQFAQALVCSPRDGQIWFSLKSELNATASDTIRHLDAFLARWKSGGNAALHPVIPLFLSSWMSYITTTSWSSHETDPEQAEREWKSFDHTYAEANRIFTGAGAADSVGFLGKAMKKMAENLMHLAFRVSRRR
ncbi:hypothetical protein QFC19_006216 [Naganishia cerealis]|uniref:Uncharacterized protein n=1 Tax=Naganishia cerealis TaxID=610337 RepID=A0ACC2VIB0_9TREE|nr:hypothetical protein QFC19_006216 [Naganishia cerealis]